MSNLMSDFTIIEAGTFVSADAMGVVNRIAITPVELEDNHLVSDLVVSLAERHLEQNLEYDNAMVMLPSLQGPGLELVGGYDLSLSSFKLLRSLVGNKLRIDAKGLIELQLSLDDTRRFLKYFRYKKCTKVLKGGIEALTEYTARRAEFYRSLMQT